MQKNSQVESVAVPQAALAELADILTLNLRFEHSALMEYYDTRCIGLFSIEAKESATRYDTEPKTHKLHRARMITNTTMTRN